MQRYPAGAMGGAERRMPPLAAAVALGEAIRYEHGREGAERFLQGLTPLMPLDFLEQAAELLGVEKPQPRAEKPVQAQKKPAAQIPPQQLMGMLRQMQGGGKPDPATLLSMLGKRGEPSG